MKEVLLLNEKTGHFHRWSEVLAKRGRYKEVPADQYIRVPPPPDQWVNRYNGETVVCIASGPSLSDEQLAVVRIARERGICKVIVINNCYARAPWADMMYARDFPWWNHYRPEFQGEKWTGDWRSAMQFRLNYVESHRGQGLNPEYGKIFNGGNSGYQALSLAVKMGAAKVILIGYDMQCTGGNVHWFGKHPKNLKNPTHEQMAEWVRNMEQLAKDIHSLGVEVINCTLESALTCFPRGDIAEQLGL